MHPFTQKPFYLDTEALSWVETTFARLTLDEKIGQLFVLMSLSDDPEELERFKAFKPGGLSRLFQGDHERDLLDSFAAVSGIPLLAPHDLEGNTTTPRGGTPMPTPLAMSAVDDPALTAKAARIMGNDAKAVGGNWVFDPVLDIGKAFHSSIVGTRSFGSDPARIKGHALAGIETWQGMGMAATLKHWPGEGLDDRDQHLVTTINPLSVEEWDATFGDLYRAGIDAGAMTVMPAHIALPAYCRMLGAEEDAFRPASVNRHLNITLLREKLGFNGLCVSDATPMAGFGAWDSRRIMLPEVIENGCDMILFQIDLEQDFDFMKEAVADGRLSLARIDEAVQRVLALKAALGLHKTGLIPLGDADKAGDATFATDFAAKVPTLVKDTKGILPMTPDRYKRVLLIAPGVQLPFVPHPLPLAFTEMLKDAGFEVTVYEKGQAVSADLFDLVLYAFADESLLTKGFIRLNWKQMMGDFEMAMRRFWHDIPTIMVSFGHAHYLYDAPRVPVYVNAYTSARTVQAATLDCLMGRAPFVSTSPVDAFCGLPDAHL